MSAGWRQPNDWDAHYWKLVEPWKAVIATSLPDGKSKVAPSRCYAITSIGAASGDYLHLAILYPYYRTQISQIFGRPVRFPWGEQAVAVTDGIQLRALLYDDTGKVAAGVSRTGEGLCTIDHPLIGDFYIEEDISVQNTARCGNAQW